MVECPGCKQRFQQPWLLNRHLENAPAKRQNDSQWLANNYPPCQKEISRSLFGTVRSRSTEVQALAAREDLAPPFDGCGCNEVERVGLTGSFLNNGLAWVRRQGLATEYVRQSKADTNVVENLCALIAHSIEAIKTHCMVPTCSSTCIGVGELCQRIDDVTSHHEVYTAALSANDSVADCLLHLHCAHLFPAPHFGHAAAEEIKDKKLAANRETLSALYQSLLQRLGKPKLGVLCPRAHLYVGSKILNVAAPLDSITIISRGPYYDGGSPNSFRQAFEKFLSTRPPCVGLGRN